MKGHFSTEQVNCAKETSLTDFAEYYGYHPKLVGNQLYTLQEHDSMRIYHDRTWYRWSKAGVHGEGGGSQIDFLMQFCDVDSVSEAIRILLEFQGMSPDEAQNWNTLEKPLHRAGEKKEVAFILKRAGRRKIPACIRIFDSYEGTFAEDC